MPNYHRYYLPNHLVFITLVTAERKPMLTERWTALKKAIQVAKIRLPFSISAMVVLPDHCHMILRLPESDPDFSLRVSQIKSSFSRLVCDAVYPSTSRIKRRERGVWQRRFWDHVIRDEEDLHRHLDYIHYNPVKHGYTKAPMAWLYSTFLKYVNQGLYPTTWGQAQAPQQMSGLQTGE
ncbi:MAG: transposase [Gammaproteobacteria bacterium]|nr:transposase [Gammaproteobacteria bacterium]